MWSVSAWILSKYTMANANHWITSEIPQNLYTATVAAATTAAATTAKVNRAHKLKWYSLAWFL